uniref:LOW QUALITY PROTEIN: G protein-coupled receptor kinase 5-like n=1 Tax=Gasterosteus aculeatus aculeatus TaxID=481459 RepID=UPI001A991283|nr:LOW QUALITY PROTEIN: G protein-coupled receptor kinase 5-like [Gasterosteus aculeatus aculeatus]
MEIESIMANNSLVKAREGGGGKGRSLKWRDMLRFSHVTRCADLGIARDYLHLCVEQPIGKKLFQLFCRSRPDLQNYISMQDAVDAFQTKSDEERRDFGFRIIQRFLWSQSNQCVSIVQHHEQSCLRSLELDPCMDVFHECTENLHQYLSGEPFLQYQDSMFFDRFLQWKMLERQPITKQTFRQYRLLGKGGFGEVWACQVRATGMMYACKKLNKTHVKKRKGETMALNEKQILERLNSRFVVNLAYSYETKHALCMVLTMMSGGDLKYHIHSIGAPGLEEDRARFYAAEVCCGLIHLHQNAILYRDLKPENILLDDLGHIRISDLGLSVRVSRGSAVRGMVGTLGYMAPEVISRRPYGVSVDWWGLGCLLYEMTAGRPPLHKQGEHLNPPEMERRILKQEPEYGDKFSAEVKDLCSSVRPSAEAGLPTSGGGDVTSHPFFRGVNFRMLQAGQVEPPFKPDPRLVFCTDVQDMKEFSSVKEVILDQKDNDFYAKFSTRKQPNTIIETGCFRELNQFGPNGSRSPDLDWSLNPEIPKRSLLDRLFGKQHHEESKQALVTNGTTKYTL